MSDLPTRISGESRREVRWDRMFRDELEQSIRDCPLVYLPYGLCEPHGSYDAVGLDGLKAHALCCRAAHAHGGIVAPVDFWHVHEVASYAEWGAGDVGEARPWLTAVPPWIHFKNVCYHVRAADALGFEAAILVTGHYGPNWEDLKQLVSILGPHFDIRLYGLPDYEAIGDTSRVAAGTGDHAGRIETSQLWALAPECVDLSRCREEPEGFAAAADAIDSSRRLGEEIVATQVEWLGRKASELLAEFGATERRGPRSFADVEAIWRAEVEPLLPEFRSMLGAAELGEQPVEIPADSRWRLNHAARAPGRS